MKKFLIIAALVATSACTSSSDLGRGKTGQSFTVTGKSYEQIWIASVAAVKETASNQAIEVEKNLNVQKADQAKGEIIATTGMSLWSWGELVGVYIDPPMDAPVHKIEVESRAKMQTDIVANNWEEEIILGIKKRLN